MKILFPFLILLLSIVYVNGQGINKDNPIERIYTVDNENDVTVYIKLREESKPELSITADKFQITKAQGASTIQSSSNRSGTITQQAPGFIKTLPVEAAEDKLSYSFSIPFTEIKPYFNVPSDWKSFNMQFFYKMEDGPERPSFIIPINKLTTDSSISAEVIEKGWFNITPGQGQLIAVVAIKGSTELRVKIRLKDSNNTTIAESDEGVLSTDSRNPTVFNLIQSGPTTMAAKQNYKLEVDAKKSGLPVTVKLDEPNWKTDSYSAPMYEFIPNTVRDLTGKVFTSNESQDIEVITSGAGTLSMWINENKIEPRTDSNNGVRTFTINPTKLLDGENVVKFAGRSKGFYRPLDNSSTSFRFIKRIEDTTIKLTTPLKFEADEAGKIKGSFSLNRSADLKWIIKNDIEDCGPEEISARIISPVDQRPYTFEIDPSSLIKAFEGRTPRSGCPAQGKPRPVLIEIVRMDRSGNRIGEPLSRLIIQTIKPPAIIQLETIKNNIPNLSNDQVFKQVADALKLNTERADEKQTVDAVVKVLKDSGSKNANNALVGALKAVGRLGLAYFGIQLPAAAPTVTPATTTSTSGN